MLSKKSSRIEILHRILEQHKMRKTDQRDGIFSIFSEAEKPLTPAEVAQRTRYIADQATTYRTIDTFVSIGVLHKVSNGWKDSYELSETFIPHHHHFTCESCGKIAPFDEPAQLNLLLRQVAANQLRAELHHHSVELSGLCDNCCVK